MKIKSIVILLLVGIITILNTATATPPKIKNTDHIMLRRARHMARGLWIDNYKQWSRDAPKTTETDKLKTDKLMRTYDFQVRYLSDQGGYNTLHSYIFGTLINQHDPKDDFIGQFFQGLLDKFTECGITLTTLEECLEEPYTPTSDDVYPKWLD